MFGYVSINPQALSQPEQQRFRALYCGLCRTLGDAYGDAGRLTLSNDMTFLALLLGAVYEPEETCRQERCALHPLKEHAAVTHAATAYAADMNILLAYYKCVDDARDDGALRGRAGRAALEKPFRQVRQRWPIQCGTVADSLERIAALERETSPDPDALTRQAGRMLGACFVWKNDVFAPSLRAMGDALGRFIYLMDAYEDYDRDEKRGRFNPLRGLPDFRARMEDILTLEMSRCVDAYDFLPVTQDDAIIRNVLYSGVWGRYARMQSQRKETQA